MNRLDSLRELYQNATFGCFYCDEAFQTVWRNPFTENNPLFRRISDLAFILPEEDFSKLKTELQKGNITDFPVATDLLSTVSLRFQPFLEKGSLCGVFVIIEKKEHNPASSQKYYEYISGVTSSYRTTLFSIFNRLSLLGQTLETREMYSELDDINQIVYQCYRILRTTMNLSSYFLLKTGDDVLHLKQVNINRYMEHLLTSVQMRLRFSEINFSFELDSEQVNTLIDPDKFDTMMLNLLLNSCLYTSPGNEIKVSMKKVQNSFILTVLDKGAGIPQEQLSQVFEPFYTYDVNEDGSNGMGIGLKLVDMIARAHGGSCVINSMPNQGTSISLNFPIEPPSADCNLLSASLPDYVSNKFSPLYVFLGEVSGYQAF